MAESEIVMGSVVILKSGGPEMTVDYIENGRVDCVWFLENLRYESTFGLETLEKVR